MRLFRWLRDLWHARQRMIDVDVLWPACRKAAPTLDRARAAFAVHAFNDPAWQRLGDAEIIRRIDELE